MSRPPVDPMIDERKNRHDIVYTAVTMHTRLYWTSRRDGSGIWTNQKQKQKKTRNRKWNSMAIMFVMLFTCCVMLHTLRLLRKCVSSCRRRSVGVSSACGCCYYPRESERICFCRRWRWFVCLPVCLSVTMITKNIVDGFVPILWEGS